jgi:hypothetical protein
MCVPGRRSIRIVLAQLAQLVHGSVPDSTPRREAETDQAAAAEEDVLGTAGLHVVVELLPEYVRSSLVVPLASLPRATRSRVLLPCQALLFSTGAPRAHSRPACPLLHRASRTVRQRIVGRIRRKRNTRRLRLYRIDPPAFWGIEVPTEA